MLKSLTRTLAFLSNWTAWVVRQPSMLLTMIVGPFIILGLFAFSNAAAGVRAEVIVVSPQNDGGEVAVPPETLQQYFNVATETDNVEWARQELRERRVSALILLPQDPRQQLAQGRQVEITVETNEIDPISLAFLRADLRGQVAELNKLAQTQGLERVKSEAARANQRFDSSLGKLDGVESNADNPEVARQSARELDGELAPALDTVPGIASAARASTLLLPSEQAQPVLQEATEAQNTAAAARATMLALRAETESPAPDPGRIRQLSSQLREQINSLKSHIDAVRQVPTTAVVAPFEGEVQQIAAYQPTLITYFAPAALALLLQHFAVTLAALSMVRARLLGMVEFWRLAPVQPSEVVAGNYFSYGLLAFLTWGVLTLGVIYLLGVPVLGDIWLLVGAAALLILASLGIGFIISLLAGNEQQAAQLAMLVLLASVFLSGFVRPLDAIQMPVRLASYLLPASFGIELFQDLMLRGAVAHNWFFLALGALALGGIALTLLLFRRELRPT
ncbi:MAG: ABC transporter permease [Chloroflexota bacterium]